MFPFGLFNFFGIVFVSKAFVNHVCYRYKL
jgi:hypothetical protein